MTDITTLDITPEEVRTGRITPVHLSAATRALRDDGIVVLNDIVSMDHIAALREKMLHDLPAYLARTDAPFNFNTGNVQQEPPPSPLKTVLRPCACAACPSRYSGTTTPSPNG